MVEGDGDPRHGSVNGYVNQRCHCTECRAAWNRSSRARRLERIELFRLGLAAPERHSRTTYINWACRCDVCSKDYDEYKQSRRVGKKPR